MCVDDWYSKPYKNYFDEDAIDRFWNYMIKENESYSNVIETKFNKPLIISEKDNEDFNNSTKWWVCKNHFKKISWKQKILITSLENTENLPIKSVI